MKIYPAVDIKNGNCVRLSQGVAENSICYFQNPEDPAKEFEKMGSSWVHVVDLDGAFSGSPKNVEALKRIALCKINVQFGGGLRNLQNVADALDAGATRVVIGTRAVENEAFVGELVQKFGNDKIAVGIDAKNGFVAVKGWVDVTDVSAVSLAKRVAKLGVKTIIYTDIATDGMLKGPNFQALEDMLAHCPANIIASGGVSCFDDVAKIKELSLKYANVDGVIVGKAIYEKRVDLSQLLKLEKN